MKTVSHVMNEKAMYQKIKPLDTSIVNIQNAILTLKASSVSDKIIETLEESIKAVEVEKERIIRGE